MKRSITIVSFIYLIALSTISFAETDTSSKSVVEQVKPIVKVDSEKSEAHFYKLLFENSVKSNDRIIVTMQWTIGIVVMFILLLLGSQVFFNYRISKEEVNTIRSELEKRLSDLSSELQNNLNKTSSDYEKSAQLLLQNMEANMKDTINSQFEEKEKLFGAINELNKKDNELLKNELEAEIRNLSITLKKTEGHVWRLRGVDANALTRFIDTVKLEIERGYVLQYSLEEIERTLITLDKIYVVDHEELSVLLPKIDEEHKEIIDRIESLYKKLPKYTFVDDPDNPGNTITKFV